MASLAFWQNEVSMHQAPFIKAVAAIWAGEVHVLTSTDLSETRSRMGWVRPDFAPAQLHVGPHRFAPAEMRARFGGAGSVNVFSSVRAYPAVYDSLKRLSRDRESLLGIFAEAGLTTDGLKARLRPWRHRLDALQWRRRIDFFLATGSLGVGYYSKCGYPADRLYEFGYTVGNPPALESERVADGKRLLFVGQLVHRKGLDLLLEALARLREVTLDVVGEGAQREQLIAQAGQLGLASRVHWHGSLANAHVRAAIARANVLVLPSRFDGWGAVVNEALLAGTPVLVSDACGASDLVRGHSHGRVFRSHSVEALESAIVEFLSCHRDNSGERTRIRQWARCSISPEAMAHYFLNIVRSAQGIAARPSPPWR